MSILPLGNILTIAEHEYEKTCEAGTGCDLPAEWAGWARHNSLHRPITGFLCHIHKDASEQSFIEALDMRKTCSCGHRYTGQLSDNFRAIRL